MLEDKRIYLMKSAPVKKAVNSLAAPAVLGLFVMAIYNFVDTMFVSWIAMEATAATQVIMPIMMIASSIGLAFGIGGGSYISRLLGKGNIPEAERTVATALFSGALAGLIFMTAGIIFLEPILTVFGADASIMELTKEYGFIIFLGIMPSVLNMVLNNLLRAEGSSKLSMIGMATGALLNIILDPIMIFVFDWGIAGAAIATSLSQCVTSVILISNYLRKKTVLKIKIKRLCLKWKMYKEILSVGLPTFLRQVLMSISIGMLNTAAVTYGAAPLLAAVGIVTKVTMLPMYVVFGLGQGFQPVAGYNLGAGERERVMGSFKYTAIISTAFMFATCVVLITFSRQIFYIFKASESVVYYGVRGMRFYSLSLLTLGFSNTVSVLYQALGRAKEALFMSISRQGLFFLPAIAVMPLLMGTDGVFFAQLAADILTFAATLILIIPFIRKKKIDELILKANA